MTKELDPQWAWDGYRPSAENPWDLRKVGHLYRRAGFGAAWLELQSGLQLGPEQCLDRFLKGESTDSSFDGMIDATKSALVTGNNGNGASAWWLYRILHGSRPLHEKMTLFWHNHFATSNSKVQSADFMLGQYDRLHKHALGSFRTLLLEMSTDPAMMVWLDTAVSKKGMPNENYARELMELFSLGIGHYTEKDIREAARAFTGWSFKPGPDGRRQPEF
jgi:hypothetical protein